MHDICYEARNSTKLTCDTEFYKNIQKACGDGLSTGFPEIGRKACDESANKFYKAVRSKEACKAFLEAQEASGVSNPSCN